MRAHFLAVLVAHIFRSNLDALLRFQIDERGRFAEIGPDFLRIENMKQDYFISVEAQRLDGPDDLFGRFVKVRDENDDSAPPQELLKMVEWLGEIRPSARFRLLESAQ